MADTSTNSCIRCGYSAGEKDQYCVACGAPVINTCMGPEGLLDEPCNHINPSNAAFCAKCGSYTAFYHAGLIHSPHTEDPVLRADEFAEFNWFSHRFFQ